MMSTSSIPETLPKGTLSKGRFTTPIAGVHTKVEYEIRNNYQVRATFRSHGSDYEFIMDRWTKIAADPGKPIGSFDKFAQLILDIYSEETILFRNVDRTDSSITHNYGQKEIINMLKYSMRQVFVCAEEIIQTHRPHIIGCTQNLGILPITRNTFIW